MVLRLGSLAAAGCCTASCYGLPAGYEAYAIRLNFTEKTPETVAVFREEYTADEGALCRLWGPSLILMIIDVRWQDCAAASVPAAQAKRPTREAKRRTT